MNPQAMGGTPGARDADARPMVPGAPDLWDEIVRQIEAQEQLQQQLAAAGRDPRAATVELLGRLQALRERLHALRRAAASTARLARRAAGPGAEPASSPTACQRASTTKRSTKRKAC